MRIQSNPSSATSYVRVTSTDHVDAVTWITFVILATIPFIREQANVFDTTIGMKPLVALPQIFFSLCVLNHYRHFAVRFDRRWGLLLVACLVWVGLSTLLADHFYAALVRQAEWVTHGVFSYAVFMLVCSRPEWEYRLLKTFSAGLLIYLLFLLFFWHILPYPEEYNWVSSLPGFSNIRHVGYYAMAVVPLSLHIMAQAKTENSFYLQSGFWFGLACMTAAWFLLAWSGGRAPLLGLSTAVVLLFLFRWKWTGIVLTLATLLSAVTGAMLSLFYSIPGQGIGRFFTRTFQFENASLSVYSSSRTDFWMQAFYRVLENPFFGLGPDGYLFDAARPNLTSVHPHSSILQIMLEWGIPGTLLFAAISISGMLFLVVKHKPVAASDSSDSKAEETIRHFALIWAMLSLLGLSVVDGSLYHAHPMMLLSVIIGVAVAKVKNVSPIQGRMNMLLSVVLMGSACLMILHTASLYLALNPSGRSHVVMEVVTRFPSGLSDRRTKGPLEDYIRSEAGASPCAIQRLLETASRMSRPNEAIFFSLLEQELGVECKREELPGSIGRP